MSQTVSPSTSRSYGLARVSRAWSVSRAGVYRFSREAIACDRSVAPVRQGLVRMLTWPIISAGKSKRLTFTAKAIAIYGRDCALRVRSSPRRVRRVMGENGLLAPHRVGRNQEKTHDGIIVTDKVNEMWGTDMSADRHPRGRAGLCFRRRRTRELRNHRHSRRAFSQSLRGAGAGPAGGASVLRLHRARCGAWAQAASRSRLQLHVRRFPGRDQMSGHRSFTVLRARTRGQWRRRALHPNLEGELALGADVQNHRGTARRARRIRQALQ